MMKIDMVKIEELFHQNEAGELLLNIYCGCERICPFCYWQTDPLWASRLTVYADAAERLQEAIGALPRRSKISLCWKGSPYPDVERELELTRKCLKILLEHDMEVTITASCGNGLILRDLDLLTMPGAKVMVVLEMTRLDVVTEFNRTGAHPAFETANALKRGGAAVCVTISPVMPGITDVERMAAALPEIPVHIAKLDVRPGTLWGEKTLEYIRANAPELYPDYEEIARTGKDPYFEALKRKYDGTGQIRPYLPFWDEIPSI